MANANAGDNPDDGNPYSEEKSGPAEFVFDTREAAVDAARSKGMKTQVSQKRIDGEQKYVVECRCETKSTGASDVDVWRDDL